MSTKPNTNQITYDTGSNKQDLNNILDTVVPIADYTALRAYTGRATQVRITAEGIAGFFKRNGNTSDNGGTVIVDGLGRSWERVFDGLVQLEWFGPDGTGATNSDTAINACNSVCGYVVLNPGNLYKVSSNLEIGAIVTTGSTTSSSGAFTIDAGVTLGFQQVMAPDSCGRIFEGAGTAASRTNAYNINWFAGATVDVKWVMLRRALVEDINYSVHFHTPNALSPAANISSGKVKGFKLAAPMKFDDPENLGTIYTYCPFYCTSVSVIDSMLEFSPVNKTENIFFPNGIELYGGNKATDGILYKGGARIQFFDHVTANGFLRYGVNITASLYPIDEPYFDFINTTGCGAAGVNIEGTSAANSVISGKINFLFSNGMLPGGSSVYRVKGSISAFNIDEIFLSTAIGIYDAPTTAVGVVTNNSDASGRAPRGLTIGKCYALGVNKPALVVTDSSGGVANKTHIEIFRQNAVEHTSTEQIHLEWVDAAVIHPQRADTNTNLLLRIGDNVDNIVTSGVDPRKITYTNRPARMIRDGRHIQRVTIENDGSTTVSMPTSATGKISVICLNDNNALFEGAVRLGAVLNSTFSGTATSTTLNTASKMNVAVSSSVLTVQNKLGSPREFMIIIDVV